MIFTLLALALCVHNSIHNSDTYIRVNTLTAISYKLTQTYIKPSSNQFECTHTRSNHHTHGTYIRTYTNTRRDLRNRAQVTEMRRCRHFNNIVTVKSAYEYIK